MSELLQNSLHVSKEFLSVPLLVHHGDIKPPSDAVSNDDVCECGVRVHSDAVTNSSSVDDLVYRLISYLNDTEFVSKVIITPIRLKKHLNLVENDASILTSILPRLSMLASPSVFRSAFSSLLFIFKYVCVSRNKVSSDSAIFETSFNLSLIALAAIELVFVIV